MRVKRSTVFSSTGLLLLLLVMPRDDPSNFSAQTGRSLILDPGVSLSLCFSAHSRGRGLPDPGLFLSMFTSQELANSLCDFSKCFMLSLIVSIWNYQVSVQTCMFLHCVRCIGGRESSMLPFLPLGSDSASFLQNLRCLATAHVVVSFQGGVPCRL